MNQVTKGLHAQIWSRNKTYFLNLFVNDFLTSIDCELKLLGGHSDNICVKVNTIGNDFPFLNIYHNFLRINGCV